MLVLLALFASLSAAFFHRPSALSKFDSPNQGESLDCMHLPCFIPLLYLLFPPNASLYVSGEARSWKKKQQKTNFSSCLRLRSATLYYLGGEQVLQVVDGVFQGGVGFAISLSYNCIPGSIACSIDTTSLFTSNGMRFAPCKMLLFSLFL